MDTIKPRPPFWTFDSPLIYIFGGITLLLVLIMVALLIVIYTDRNRRLAAGGDRNLEGGGGSLKTVYEAGDEADVSPKIVVIMAGDELPTYLATPTDVLRNATHIS
ncbi:hypothetical protein Lser_V15G20410 [Lactuca serriola]